MNAALNAITQPESGPGQVTFGVQLHLAASESIADFVIELPFDLPGNALPLTYQFPFDPDLTVSRFEVAGDFITVSAENTSASPLTVTFSWAWAIYPVVR